MVENVENLILEHLRHMRGQIDAIREDVHELKTTQAGVLQILAAHDYHLLRIEMPLERIEKRFDLVEA